MGERVERAFAIKLGGQILAHTAHVDPRSVFDAHSGLIQVGGKIIEVALEETNPRPCFSPSQYVYINPDGSFSTGKVYSYKSASQPEPIDKGHTLISEIRKLTGLNFSCDAIFLVEVEYIGAEPFLRLAYNFIITNDGDSTTTYQEVRKKGISEVIRPLLTTFNYALN